MTFERINDLKIQVLFTKEDFDERQLLLSELQYGNETTRLLFQEILSRAEAELDFLYDDRPLMIEAIPVADEGLLIQITQISEADELDTRFAKFSPYDHDETPGEYEDSESLSEAGEHTDYNMLAELLDNFFGTAKADELMKEFEEIPEADDGSAIVMKDNPSIISTKNPAISDSPALSPYTDDNQPTDEAAIDSEGSLSADHTSPSSSKKGNTISLPVSGASVFLFSSLEDVISFAGLLPDISLTNHLYKDEERHLYYLCLSSGQGQAEEYHMVCRELTEYANPAPASLNEVYMQEHLTLIHGKDALQFLKQY